MMMRKISSALFMLLTFACPLQGHDLWVTKTDDGYAVMRGRLPDSVELYRPSCIEELVAFDAKGAPLPVKRVDRERRVVVQTPSVPALVAVVAAWGHRIIDEDGKKHFMSRAQAGEAGIRAREAFSSTQYSKTLFSFDRSFGKPLGMRFEVVPQCDPFALQKGELLPVQVLFDGMPLSNCRVQSGMNTDSAETDANGRAQIPLQGSGWHKLAVIHDIPAPQGSAIDYQRFFAFLVFQLK